MFRVSLDLSDDEIDAYEAIVERIASTYLSPRADTGLITMGCVVAFGCAGLLYAAGAVGQGGGAAITALVFGAYWVGAWAPSIWAWLVGRMGGGNSRDHVRRGLQGAVLIVGARRLAWSARAGVRRWTERPSTLLRPKLA